MRCRDDRADRIARTGADIAGLCAHNQRAARVRECRHESIHAHAALIVHRHDLDLVAAEPEISQCANRRDVRFGANQHAHPRRALQAIGLHVPPGAAQHLVPRRGEAREVRHVTAGDEAHAGLPRQIEQLQDPAGDDVFDR
jgi:hypothetical protein